jgi:hypothetical protein
MIDSDSSTELAQKKKNSSAIFQPLPLFLSPSHPSSSTHPEQQKKVMKWLEKLVFFHSIHG